MYVDIKISLKNILSKEPQTQSNINIATSPIDIKVAIVNLKILLELF